MNEPRQIPSESVTERTECQNPDDGANGVVDREDAHWHPRYAGEDSREASHERNEATKENGLGTMLLEELVGGFHARRREQDPAAVPRDERRSPPDSEPVARMCAGHRADAGRDDDARDRQRPAP